MVKITLKHIAKKANVSISTVSRIINNDEKNPVSKKTSEKVWKIINELGYITDKITTNPNVKVDALKYNQEKNTKVIGCILASSKDTYNDPFFSEIIRGIQYEVAKNGYVLAYSYTSCEMSSSALYNLIVSNKVEGLIIIGRYNERLMEFIRSSISNIVYTGLNCSKLGFDQVICDGFKAACCAIEHLISLGHKKIAYIGSAPRNNNNIINEHRFNAYLYTLKKYDIKLDENFIRHIVLSTEDSYRNIKNMLIKGYIPTAVFCANDTCAVGTMKAIHELGFKIPDEISIISINNIEISEFVNPPLTTIHVPKKDLGKFSVKLLIDRIQNGHNIPIRIDLPFKLIIRKSCCKPRV